MLQLPLDINQNTKKSLNCKRWESEFSVSSFNIPKRPHDQLVLAVSLLEHHHLHRVDGWRYFDAPLLGLGHRVVAGLSAADSLHEHGAPGCKEPDRRDAPPADYLEHVGVENVLTSADSQSVNVTVSKSTLKVDISGVTLRQTC